MFDGRAGARSGCGLPGCVSFGVQGARPGAPWPGAYGLLIRASSPSPPAPSRTTWRAPTSSCSPPGAVGGRAPVRSGPCAARVLAAALGVCTPRRRCRSCCPCCPPASSAGRRSSNHGADRDDRLARVGRHRVRHVWTRAAGHGAGPRRDLHRQLRRGGRRQRARPRDHGLPEAVSGHNEPVVLGPGQPARHGRGRRSCRGCPEHGASLLVAQLRREFAQIRSWRTLGNAAHVVNQEAGGRVYLCRGPRRPWGQAMAHAAPLRLTARPGHT